MESNTKLLFISLSVLTRQNYLERFLTFIFTISVERAASQATVYLCDEFYMENLQLLLGEIRDDQNCILFTSATDCNLGPTFDTIHLKVSLRSTIAITCFAENWRHFSNNDSNFECLPGHNFDGENVTPKVINKLNAYPSGLLEYPNFIAQCASSILQVAEKCKGLPILPVICFMSHPLRNMLFSTLKILFPDHRCINQSSGLQVGFQHLFQRTLSREEFGNEGPPIVLFEPQDIDGCEFGTVVILISYMHLKDLVDNSGIHSIGDASLIFFRAITRASVKITILISELQLAECRELDIISPQTFQDCCLKQLFDSYFDKTVRIVCERATNKPEFLFVGKRPVSSSIQKRKHPRSDLPNIEGLTEYVSGNRFFLHIDDLFEETSLEALRKFGIKFIYIFPENWLHWHQFECYGSTNKIIADFTWKNGKPFEVETILNSKIELISSFSSLLKWLTSHSQAGLITYLKNIERIAEMSQMDETISWDRWKGKAGALYRIGDMSRAFSTYTLAFRSLLWKSSSDHSLPVRKKKEAAKILTNLSLLYLTSSSSQFSFQNETASKTRIEKQAEDYVWSKLLFKNGFCDLPSSTAALLKAMLLACYATKFNVCWSKSYVRMKTGVKSLKEKYREYMYLENAKQIKNVTRLKILINDDKKLSESGTFWDASELTNPVDRLDQLNPSLSGSELTAHLTKFRESVSDYRKKLQSATTENLITLVKKISNSVEDLWKSGLEFIEQSKQVTSRLESIATSHPTAKRLLIEDVLKWDIQLGLYAVRWDPTKVVNYEKLLKSLESFETLIEQLCNQVKQIPE